MASEGAMGLNRVARLARAIKALPSGYSLRAARGGGRPAFSSVPAFTLCRQDNDKLSPGLTVTSEQQLQLDARSQWGIIGAASGALWEMACAR